VKSILVGMLDIEPVPDCAVSAKGIRTGEFTLVVEQDGPITKTAGVAEGLSSCLSRIIKIC
jgi:hypothetical protein